jgi:hypothetical protein
MTDEEKALVRAGVRASREALYDSLHSEDDLGYDAARWLKSREDQIVEKACGQIDAGRAALVD